MIKRSGELVEFDLQKICNAVQKAFDATKTAYTEDMIELIAMRVTSDFQDKIADGRIDVESIQDSAEKVIAACGFEEVAKAYILYRQQRARLREMRQTVLDYRDVVNSYVYMDARELASPDDAAISIGGLILSNSAAVTERYWLSEIYDEEITYAHKNGDIHIHDLSMLTGGSAGWPLIRLIREGLGGVSGQNTSAPARHLPVLCGQLVSFATLAQNEWAGAQTFSSFDTYLAPYVKADHLSYDAVYRIIESFVFGINLPTGIGMQPPFVILALDGVIPGDLYHEPAYVGSEQMSFTYGDCQREASMIAGALLSVLLEGDANGARFAYPVLVYGVTDAFDKDENASLALSLAIKYGTIQFANYIGGDISPEDLRMFSSGEMPDTDRLAGKAVGSYGSGEQCGSIGTVSINLARIAYQSVNEQEFYHRIDHILAIAARALKTKRSVLTQLHGEGLFPYTARYFGDFTRAFSTIGVLGMNEAVLNASWIREDLTGGKAKRFAKEVLVHLRAKIRLYQEMYGDYHELQATTEEAVRLRLAKSDRMEFPKILLANHPGEAPVYTAGSELADDCEGEPAKLSEAQDLLQIQYNGGTIFRIPVDDGPDQVRRKTGLLGRHRKRFLS